MIVPVAETRGIDPDLPIMGRLNGTVIQSSRTSDLIFGVGDLIAYLTTVMTMEPGDLVPTGTPSGVRFASNPPRSLAANDVFEVSVEAHRVHLEPVRGVSDHFRHTARCQRILTLRFIGPAIRQAWRATRRSTPTVGTSLMSYRFLLGAACCSSRLGLERTQGRRLRECQRPRLSTTSNRDSERTAARERC